METASQLAENGIKIFRAGIWKPRTKPGGFEGVGAEGLAWMRRVKEELGMLTATEVATRQHVKEALAAGIDILWIGARTSANPFAMQEIADTLAEAQMPELPVLVKNPVNPDLELWIGALQRIYNAAYAASEPYTVVSRSTASISTATCPNGTYLSSCAAVCHSCL